MSREYYHPRGDGERVARLSGCCCSCCCCAAAAVAEQRCAARSRREAHTRTHSTRGTRAIRIKGTARCTLQVRDSEYPPCRRTREHCSLYPDFICHFMVALIIYFFSTQRCQLSGRKVSEQRRLTRAAPRSSVRETRRCGRLAARE